MKHILEYENFLFEIGDSSAGSYDWKHITYGHSNKHDEINYEFTSDSGVRYYVKFIKISGDEESDIDTDLDTWEWVYMADTGRGKSVTDVVNRGEAYKIMATNMDIIEDFIDRLNSDERHILTFTGGFKPIRTSTSEMSKRMKLYMQFFSKRFKNYELVNVGNNAAMIIPAKT